MTITLVMSCLLLLLSIREILDGNLGNELISDLLYKSFSQIVSTDPCRGYIEGIGVDWEKNVDCSFETFFLFSPCLSLCIILIIIAGKCLFLYKLQCLRHSILYKGTETFLLPFQTVDLQNRSRSFRVFLLFSFWGIMRSINYLYVFFLI